MVQLREAGATSHRHLEASRLRNRERVVPIVTHVDCGIYVG
jgi:hypothetical protein